MAIQTVDLDGLAAQTGNIYESVVIISKRSRQIASKRKAEIDDKLQYFEGFEPEMENDPRFHEEQVKISVEYEKMPKPTEAAIHEMFDGEVYFRDPGSEPGY